MDKIQTNDESSLPQGDAPQLASRSGIQEKSPATKEPDEKSPGDDENSASAPESSAVVSEKRKKERWYNQPLPVGILILLVTFLLQQWTLRDQKGNWREQQKFIADQSHTNANVARAQGTIDQVASAVGRLLTASAIIVGAHKAKVKTAQLHQTIDRFHAMQIEWDQNEDLLKVRMRTSFAEAPIAEAWKGILDRLEELDSLVVRLSEFKTNDSSADHSKQIKECEDTISDIEQRLAEMTRLMNDKIGAAHTTAS